MKKQSLGRTVLSMAMALLLGLGVSGLALSAGLEYAFFTTNILFAPMFIAFLYGFGGLLPALTMALCMVIGGVLGVGVTWAASIALAFALPGVAFALLSRSGMRFFRQIRLALVAQSASLLAALALLFLRFGPDLGGAAADALKSAFDMLSPAQTDAFVNGLKLLYSNMGSALEGTPQEIISLFIEGFEQEIKVNAPMLAVSVIAVNAPLGILWCNYLRARRGEDGVTYAPMRMWRLPASTVIALGACFIGTYLITYTGSVECAMVFLTVKTAAYFAFTAQAAASILSRMHKAGMSARKRNALFILMYIFLGYYLEIYGAASALFGSQGVFTPMIKARIEKMRKDREDK